MILELDLGNTRGKWRIMGADGVPARGAGDIAAWCRGDLPAAWRGVERVRIASVLDADAESQLTVALATLAVPVVFARSSAHCGGVANAYAAPERLGVDRWLALLAAYREFANAVLVIDVGSALTLDLVDAGGRHRGGYIIPGARLMADALLRATGRVRFETGTVLASTAPGARTADCVHNGIALAVAGAARLGLAQARAELGAVAVVLAGGDAPALAQLLADEILHLRPDLVLDGLQVALP